MFYRQNGKVSPECTHRCIARRPNAPTHRVLTRRSCRCWRRARAVADLRRSYTALYLIYTVINQSAVEYGTRPACKGQLQVNEELEDNKQLAASSSGGIDRAAAVARPRSAVPVRYSPLGSPTDASKRSYVHVLRVTGPWRGGSAGHERGLVGTRGGAVGGVPGKGYTGYYPARLHWYCQGPTRPQIGIARAQPLPGTGICARQALQPAAPASAHLAPRTQIWPSQHQLGRDSINNILKLVNIPECRLKSVMRPAILPV